LVYGTYLSFRQFELWNAWFRLWAVGVMLGDLRLSESYYNYLRTRDESVLPDAEEPLGLFASNHRPFGELFANAFAEMLKFDDGTQAAGQTCDQIFSLLREMKFMSPAIRIPDPSQKVISLSGPAVAIRTFLWALTEAPPEIKQMTRTSMRVLLPRSLQSWA